MAMTKEALRALGFTPAQVEAEMAHRGETDGGTSIAPKPLGDDAQIGKRRVPARFPCSIRVGPANRVPGFQPGQLVRLVEQRGADSDVVYLTPVDLAALVNILEGNRTGESGVGTALLRRDGFPGTDEEVSEAERMWRTTLAAAHVFPGSKVLQ